MMKPIFLLISFLLISICGQAQCNEYFDYKPGMVMQMGNYNSKGKLIGKQRMAIKKVQNQGSKSIIEVEVTLWDDKEKEIYEGINHFECDNGVFKMDLTSLAVNNSNMSQVEGLEAKLEGDKLFYPNNLSAGQKLPDAAFTLTMSSTNAVMNSMMSKGQTFQIVNRKVEAKESVTTPAGSFDCFKISSNTNMTMAVGPITKNVKISSIDFLSSKVGIVRTESYDEKGKLTGYSELISLKQ